MKAGHAALAEALAGRFEDHHGELAQLLTGQIAFLDEQISQLTTRIGEQLAAIRDAGGIETGGAIGPGAGTGPDAPVLPAAARLDEIPGISAELAASIIAETGLDMTRFPTPGHLVSWAGLCPPARQSGPRPRLLRTPHRQEPQSPQPHPPARSPRLHRHPHPGRLKPTQSPAVPASRLRRRCRLPS